MHQLEGPGTWTRLPATVRSFRCILRDGAAGRVPKSRRAMSTLAKSCLIGVLALFASCAQTSPPPPLATDRAPNPSAHPVRNVTDFTESLRCTDDLMLKFGTRDVVLVLENVEDKTGRIPSSGAREMLVSAISEMTRRSRAVRLVATSGDTQNLGGILQAAKRDSSFHVVPQYAWRGTFTQFDTDLQTRKSLFGALFGPFVNAATAKETSLSAIAMDANVVRTDDLTVIATATSRNVIVINQGTSDAKNLQLSGQGAPNALLSKLGITYSLTVTSQDAVAQSARALVELAAVETIGRLAQVPYWKCLGGDDASPDAQREVEDWFIGLDRDGRLSSWVQNDLRTRRRFNGPTDGQPSPAFAEAVVQARRDLGLEATDEIDLALFRALMGDRLAARPARTVHAGGSASPAPALGVATLDLRASIESGAPGAAFSLEVDSRLDQYVYCYRASSEGQIERIFPNRFHPDPMLRAGRRIELPGPDPFELTLDAKGDATRIACIASPVELYNELPPKLRWGDFHPIGFKDFASLRAAFDETAGSALAYVERAVRINAAK